MGALTIAGAALAVGGLSAVRNSTVGRYQQALGPTEPGYQASVVPTPTMGLLLRSGDGRLAGAAVLSLEPEDAGGTVALVPASIVVTDEAGAEHTLDEVYADRGAEAASQALGEVLTVAVDETVEVDEATWTQLVEPVGPVTVQLEDPVGEWAAGEVELQPSDVGRFLAARAADEPDLDRASTVSRPSGTPGSRRSATPARPRCRARSRRGWGGSSGRSPRGRARRPPSRWDARTRPTACATAPTRGASDSSCRSRSRTRPRPPPGIRIRVRLLNGTDDPALTERAARALVRSGAAVSVVGNAATFSEPETRFVHGGPQEDQARWLQQALGFGRLDPAGGGHGWSDGDRRRDRRDRDPRPRCRGHSRGSRALTDRNDRASARDLAIAAARAADDKGARDIVVLEVGDVLVVADEFVIVSALQRSAGQGDRRRRRAGGGRRWATASRSGSRASTTGTGCSWTTGT